MRGSLCGYVLLDENERPVERALVEAVAGEIIEPRTAATDSHGWFVLDRLPPGNWLVHAWTPDNLEGGASVPVFANAFSDVTIRVGGSWSREQGPQRDSVFKAWVARMQHGSVDGQVIRAATGEPVEDASVTVVRGAGPAPDIAPLTDAQGRFRLDSLPTGDWTLRAMAPGGGTGEATVRVLPGRIVGLTIVV